MKVESTVMAMQASYQSWFREENRQQLTSWTGAAGAPQNNLMAANAIQRVNISESARLSLTLDNTSTTALTVGNEDATGDNDPVNALIKSLIEMLTGRAIKTFSAADLPPAPSIPALNSPTRATPPSQSSNSGMIYEAQHVYEEHQQMSFAAEGVIRTADGQEIRFSFNLEMESHYREESQVSIRTGAAVPKTDPLVLNFNGTGAQLSNRMMRFDLNNDGQLDSLPELMRGSAYLVLDRNNNGRIDNGSELFGPASGSGFNELAVLDADKNGWIDEADPLFHSLGLWSPEADDAGQPKITRLTDAGVGALNIARLATPFALKDKHNDELGSIRDTGLFLRENGTAGSLQELDLVSH